LDSNFVTALATVVLALIGISQIFVLILQSRQKKIEFIEDYRKQWFSYKKDFGVVIFIGRDEREYYQVVNKKTLDIFSKEVKNSNCTEPTIWALDSTRNIFTLLNDLSIKILKNQINISDIYSLLGTQMLRHSKPLRVLLDKHHITIDSKLNSDEHNMIRNEIQDWLTYHDGIRRRVLILIDLLWAEAVRLEDLPPYDIESAANAKKETGSLNKERVFKECIKLNGFLSFFHAKKLAYFLKHAEYYDICFNIGVKKERLDYLDKKWTEYLLDKI